MIDHYDKQLVLLALGPTATVLACDLSKEGIQALDIGHVDIEYEWFQRGVKEITVVPGKWTNETAEGKSYSVCVDPNYIKQIACRIGC